jgi:hypothetical protein
MRVHKGMRGAQAQDNQANPSLVGKIKDGLVDGTELSSKCPGCAATLPAEAFEIAPQSRAPVRPSSYLPGVPRRARWSAGPRAVSPKTRRTLPHARIQATGPLDIACAALLRQPCFDPLLTLPVSDK